MTKGKFVFHFADGSKMTDRNRYKTIAGARAWAKAHNMSKQTNKSERVLKITPVKKRKKK